MNAVFELKPLDYLVIAVYCIGIVAIGFWISLRRKHNADFFLAGRSLGWGTVGFSIFGTNVAPSMMIASCAIAYTDGMVSSTFEWLAWPFLILLSSVFLPHYLATKVSTMPQFLLHRYGSPSRRFLSYYAVLTICISMSTTLFAGGVLMSQIMGWSVMGCMVFLMVLATSFTIVGGLEAVSKTDIIQSLLMIGAAVCLTTLGLIKVGGPMAVIDQLEPRMWQIFRPASDTLYPWHAVILGYPVMAVWFFCTNQVIVQRALGAKSLGESQKGVVFCAYLKILTPILFAFPGLICAILYPGLEDSNMAYTTMVAGLMPVGLVGMVVAVLIAALISTINSQLNSLSTLVAMDIYKVHRKTEPTEKELTFFGRVVMAVSAVVGVVLAYALSGVKDMDLFSLIQSIIAFMAPSMSVVFLVGVMWRRATPAAALSVLVGGNIVSIGIGVCYLAKWPVGFEWPHFLLLSFYLFCALAVVLVLVSFFTREMPADKRMRTLSESRAECRQDPTQVFRIRLWWGGLAVVMAVLYLLFSWMAGW